MTFKTRNQCEEYVLLNINNGTLKEAHTRKELAEMLRVLEPYLVKQSPYTCRSMCKQRICDHLEFTVKLHRPDREYLNLVREKLKKGAIKL